MITKQTFDDSSLEVKNNFSSDALRSGWQQVYLLHEGDDRSTQDLMASEYAPSTDKSLNTSFLTHDAGNVVISVIDKSTTLVNSRRVLCVKRFADSVDKCIREVFSPVNSLNNVRIFGSKKRLQMERERSNASGYIIHPLSRFRQWWDIIVINMMLINVMVLPLDIAFFSDNHNMFLVMSDVFCVIDIVFNFRTGYKPDDTQQKLYELSGRAIALNYVRSWFGIDVVSSLPLNHIIMLILHGDDQGVFIGVKGASHALKFMKLLKLVRLIKLLRISRVMRGISAYEEMYRLTTTVIRYVKLIGMMMIVAHWNGCLQFLIPLLQDFPENCWVQLSDLHDKEWYMQYGWALFKTLSHMLSIGYGRFTPVLLSEALLTTFTMVTGATFYALFIAQSMAYLIESNYSKISYLEKMKETGEYLSYRNIPDDLRQRVHTYFNQKYIHQRYFDEHSVLAEISKPIRDDIIRYTCRDVINSIPYLGKVPGETLTSMLSMLSSNVYLSGDVIMQEGDTGSDIYFLRHGEAEIRVQGKVIETLNDGDYFGECNILVDRERLYGANAIIPCDIIILSGCEFKKLMREYAEMRPQLEHGTICRLIRIYNRCRLFNIDDSATREKDDSIGNLYDLHKKYVEQLLERVGDDVRLDNNTTTLCPGSTQSDLYKFLVDAIECHRRAHVQCNITPSWLKETTFAQKFSSENGQKFVSM